MRTQRPRNGSDALAFRDDEPLRDEFHDVAAVLAGRYTIERELGRGGMAAVYLAHDERHDRLVAIKILHAHLAREIASARFLSEIGTAATLRHPHIVPLYDSGDANGRPYYVMPYIEGRSLRARLEDERYLSLSDTVGIARDIAEALDYAHSCNVVHRDIKPDNVMLDVGHAVVADFGLARAMEAAGKDRLTSSSVRVGTPPYMSPEQAAGDPRIDGRSDVYALGCVVYEMLAGETPFTGNSPEAVIAKHLHVPPPSLRVLRPTVTPDVQQVIERALAKVPVDRFATAGEFVRALAAAATRAAHTRWRRRLAIAVAAVAVSLAAGTITRQIAQQMRARHSLPESPRIAVLYFDDLSPDSSLGHIAAGLTDELIDELSGVNAFRVVSRNGVKPFRGKRVPFDSLVAALRVNTVIDGTVQQAGDSLHASVQLIDARSNTNVDRLSVTKPLTDILALERGVAGEVAAALRRRMGRDVRLRGITSGTTSQRAKELVLKARRARDDAGALAEQPHPEDLHAALESFRSADSLLALAQRADPGWARPLIDRGWIAYQRSKLQSGPPRIPTLEEGLRHANAAVRRGGLLAAEAYELRGTLLWQLVVELEAAPSDPERMRKAEADLRAAVDRDSTLATAWATLSYLLVTKGSFAEASIAAQRALREDAYLTGARDVYLRLFFGALMLGDFVGAGEWCQRGRVALPNDWRFYECELTLLRHNVDAVPQPARAWQLVAELERLDPAAKARAAGREYHTIYRRVVAGTISARSGRRDIGRAELDRAIRATRGDSRLQLDLAYDEAYLRLVLGERERAAETLRRLVAARPVLRPQLARDPLFRDLGPTEF